MKAILGTKIGMTQLFNEDGVITPVTVVDVSDVQVSKHVVAGETVSHLELGKGKSKNATKPDQGNYKAISQVPVFKAVFKLAPGDSVIEVGTEITPDTFAVGDLIDVIGTSKGKGFQGVMKRHNFKGGPKTHGQSDKARHGGSIGSGTTPGRVIKGMKMAGHMGNERVTVQNLKIAHIDTEGKLIAISGAIPGSNGDFVIIRPALRVRQETRANAK